MKTLRLIQYRSQKEVMKEARVSKNAKFRCTARMLLSYTFLSNRAVNILLGSIFIFGKKRIGVLAGMFWFVCLFHIYLEKVTQQTCVVYSKRTYLGKRKRVYRGHMYMYVERRE